MQRKLVGVLTEELREFTVVSTGWEEFPYFLTVIFTGIYKVQEDIVRVKAGDYLIWDKNDKIIVKKKSEWEKEFGKWYIENVVKQ